MANSEESRRHAVILSGGGANGAYEIGVMRALFGGDVGLVGVPVDERALDPSIFAGTSVGSFNAAFMASKRGQRSAETLGELEEVWRNRIASTSARPNGVFRIRGNVFELLEPKRLLMNPTAPLVHLLCDGAFFATKTIEEADNFCRSKEALAHRLADLVDISDFVSTEPLRDLVRQTIDVAALLANDARALFVATTNWDKGETDIFTNRQPHDSTREKPLNDAIGHLAVLASTAIPGIFPPVEIGRTKYVDGGLLMNTPLAPAIRAGADVLHVVYLDPDLKDVPIEHGGGTLDMLNRFVDLTFASQVNRDFRNARTVNQMIEIKDRVGSGPSDEVLRRSHVV